MAIIDTLKKILSSYNGQTPSTGKEVEEAFNQNFETVKNSVNSAYDGMAQLERDLYGSSVVYTNSILKNGGFVYSSGKIVSKPTEQFEGYSDFIRVSKGSVINITSGCLGDANVLSFYTAKDDTTYIDGIVGKNTVSNDVYTAKTDGYIVLYCNSSICNFNIFSALIELASIIVEKKDINTLDGVLSYNTYRDFIKQNGNKWYNDTIWKTNQWMNTDGVAFGGADWLTDYIPILQGQKISAFLYCAESGNTISFYGEKNEASYITGIVGLGRSELKNYFFTAPSNGYVRLSTTYFANGQTPESAKLNSEYTLFEIIDVYPETLQEALTYLDINSSSESSEKKYMATVFNNSLIQVPSPINLIIVNYTTNSPLPTTKGTSIRGSASINIDGEVLNFSATLEVQGSSSAGYPEKNWTIGLFTDDTFTDEHPLRLADLMPQSEWVFKANYIDSTHCRNILCNRIFEQMIQSREGYPKREVEQILTNKTGIDAVDSAAIGHVQGFPAVFYVNEQYYGIGMFTTGKKPANYNLNKNNPDDVQFEVASNAGQIDLMSFDASATSSQIEYKSPKTITQNIVSNINAWQAFARMSQEEFNANANTYIDKTNIIDAYLRAYFTGDMDCTGRNWIFISYNAGIKLLFMSYDMDSTFGLVYSGTSLIDPSSNTWAINAAYGSVAFWEKVRVCYWYDMRARYAYLRESGVFSADNIYNICKSFERKFGKNFYAKDFEKWTEKPSTNITSVNQILEWVKARIKHTDSFFS